MPITTTDYLLTPNKTMISLAVEPAHNGFESLLLLNPAKSLSGYDEWVTQTAASLSPEILQQNELVTLGLHYAVVPMRSWSSFPAYVDNLAAQDPEHLRDVILETYANIPCREPIAKKDFDQTAVLSTLGTFLDFLYKRFDSSNVDVRTESEAYKLLINPAQMQETIVSHLRWMWENVLAKEWERRLPLLQASVDAFQQLDLRKLTAVEAAQQIIGKDLPEHLEDMLNRYEYEQIVFVPSAHLGPYLGKLSGDKTFWILFGARLPEGFTGYPDLNRSELLTRLSALSDDSRLRILHLLSTDGEKCAQDVIQILDLSQSAASRHLKQLSANGFLNERRRENGKCYTINNDRIESTFHALLNFLNN